jgi:hypothetical protein
VACLVFSGTLPPISRLLQPHVASLSGDLQGLKLMTFVDAIFKSHDSIAAGLKAWKVLTDCRIGGFSTRTHRDLYLHRIQVLTVVLSYLSLALPRVQMLQYAAEDPNAIAFALALDERRSGASLSGSFGGY